jgi:hypothetical protein
MQPLCWVVLATWDIRSQKDRMLIIFALFSELWLSQMKGYLNISHVSVHHGDTVHLLFQ